MSNHIAMLANLIENNWELIDVLLVVTGLAIYVTASHTFHQRRHPSAAIAWVLGIILLPFVTLPLYCLRRRKVVASRTANPPRRETIAVSLAHPTAARALCNWAWPWFYPTRKITRNSPFTRTVRTA